MKITFPHMGNMYISVKAMLEHLGLDVVVPPPCSKKTLTLGTQYSPEFACLPLKLNLGNFIEAHQLGADTAIMAGGCGPCRFGYYAQIEHGILQDLGYNYELVVLEPPDKYAGELIAKVRYITGRKPWWRVYQAVRFAWLKARLVDEIEMLVHKLRPRELEAGETDLLYREALQIVDDISDPNELKSARQKIFDRFSRIPADNKKDVIKIGLTGEIYTLLEPFSNLNIERHLGKMGVEVHRSILLSEWINDHLFMGFIKHIPSSREARASAAPYINHFVGGHGQETIGSSVLFRRLGKDGVLQLLPFTCMPEIVAQSILPKVSQELEIPALTLIVDEHSGEAGIITRLEAFVDLLADKKAKKEVTC